MTRASPAIQELRARAVGHSLFPATGLMAAVERLGFVQADPIRAPARAQDLILRHRVIDYRAGELERRYRRLAIDEDYLYAYGFVPGRVWQLLHPRGAVRLTRLEREVLAAVRELGVVHPRELEARFGGKRVVNAWGGLSKATTRALDHLQYRGFLRVARRDRGIRVYQAAPEMARLPPGERLRGLILAVADVLGPIAERTLQGIAARLRRSIPGAPEHRATIRQLVADGSLETSAADGISYAWPTGRPRPGEPPRQVRFLAPFDPVVWDRGRFEQLYGWSYRFEAYTPAAQRVRGYYAMPLLWIDRVIGWANAGAGGVEVGFAAGRPRDRDFSRELEAEIARLATFLSSAGGTAREESR